jgi:hypothetical protein
MGLKDFMRLHPPATQKASKFDAFKADLRTLHKNGYGSHSTQRS